MGVQYNSRIVTDGLVLALDAGNVKSSYKNFIKAKVYSVYGGGLRSANYSVQYSDDNSNWTTAFSGVCSNNTSCGIQENTGLGNGSYGYRRYWRYVEGSAVVSHHPRVSRIILTDVNGVDYNLIVYTSDNCSDTGTYIVGTVSVDFATNIWTDLSGLGNHFTLYNSPSFANGYLNFDGTNQYARSSSTIDLSSFDSVTVEIGMRVNTAVSPSGMAFEHSSDWNSQSMGFGLVPNSSGSTTYVSNSNHTNQSGGYESLNYDGVNGTDIVVHTNIWSKISDSSGRIAYINAVQRSSAATSTYPSFRNDFMYMSSRAGTSVFANHRVYFLRVYGRKLSASEISQNFNATRGRFGI